MENNINNPQAWTHFAKNDILMAEFAADKEELSGEAIFHCQQAVEKYLKAFLTKNKIPFKKTHDLGDLYLKVKEIKDFGLDEIKLERLNDLYIETRYPSSIGFFQEGSMPTVEEAQDYLNLAKKVASIVKAEF